MIPERVRTFIAVETPEELMAAIVEKSEGVREALGRGMRWTRSENIHLTVKFLGDIHRDDIPRALELLREAVGGLSTAPAGVMGPEPFPPGPRARLVVVPVEPVPALLELHKQLDGAMAGMGVKREERRFLPHITLARAKNVRPGWAADFDWTKVAGRIGMLPVSEATFFMSELGPGGPTYTPLGRLKIG